LSLRHCLKGFVFDTINDAIVFGGANDTEKVDNSTFVLRKVQATRIQRLSVILISQNSIANHLGC